MYGTIARMRLKPGIADRAIDELAAMEGNAPPGAVAVYIYRMDNNPDELYMAVLFESREAYWANAESPEQHQSFLRMMEFLVAEPDWHDGEIIAALAP